MQKNQNQNGKLVAVAMTPKQAELLQQKNGKELVVVFPGTPVSRRILFSFLRGNTIFRRLADAMVWGQVRIPVKPNPDSGHAEPPANT